MKENCDTYSSPNIVGMIVGRKRKWVMHVARMGGRCAHTFWWENMTERNHLEDNGVHERIILKRT
jgi:hypothetical protein